MIKPKGCIPGLLLAIIVWGCEKDKQPSITDNEEPIDGNDPVVIGIVVSRSSYDFGNASINAQHTANLRITNPSTSNADLVGTATAVGTYFYIVGGNLNFRVPAGSGLDVTMAYRPTVRGVHTGTITITHNVPGVVSPIIVPLRGTGL